MLLYVLKRVFIMLLIIIAVSFILFIMVDMIPGELFDTLVQGGGAH